MLRQLLLPCTFTARGTFYIENLILKFWEELNKKHQDISQEWDYMYLPWTARSRVLVSIFFGIPVPLYMYSNSWEFYKLNLTCTTSLFIHIKINRIHISFCHPFFCTHMYTNILVSKIRKFVLVNAFI